MPTLDDLYFPKRSFTLPTSDPNLISPADFSYWLKLDLWSEHEALFLLLGAHPPGEKTWWESGGPFHGNKDVEDFADVLIDLEKIFQSSVDFGELLFHRYAEDNLNRSGPLYCPEHIYTWAMRKMIRVPEEFSLYFSSKELLQTSVACMRESHDRDYNLDTRATEPDKLHPKQRQSLQKMILGMALEQYGYDPSARGSAVSQIADDLQGHGLSLDQDTIRKQLKAAAEEFLEQSIAA